MARAAAPARRIDRGDVRGGAPGAMNTDETITTQPEATPPEPPEPKQDAGSPSDQPTAAHSGAGEQPAPAPAEAHAEAEEAQPPQAQPPRAARREDEYDEEPGDDIGNRAPGRGPPDDIGN